MTPPSIIDFVTDPQLLGPSLPPAQEPCCAVGSGAAGVRVGEVTSR